MNISFRDVSKRFGDTTVVDRLNLTIPSGNFLVLLGPSGCGKTTSLRMLAGLEDVSEGSIFVGDRDVTASEPRDRDIAMVFQSYALYPHLTVAENIGYPMRIRKVPKDVRRERVEDVAQRLGIQELLDKKPKQLSGGQNQRVALGRAIVRNPKAFLMDEPLSNLDALLRLKMRSELKHLQRSLGVTTVYVTHDQEEAMTLGDVVAVMNKGVLQQVGSPGEVYEWPANVFVAGFIGKPPMNLLPARVAKPGRAATNGGCIDYNIEASMPPGSDITLGFRAKDAYLVEPSQGSMQGKVYDVQNFGDEVLVDVELRNQRIMVRSADGLAEARPGSPVGVAVEPAGLRVFSGENGVLTR